MIKKKGGYVLEDACQALLSKHVGNHSDFVLFSPRKFIGVPDGGILVSRCNIYFDKIKLKPSPGSWWMKMLEATINRREFDKFGGERQWYQLFQNCESDNPLGYFAISNLSYLLLFNAFDYAEIAKQRVENYLLLKNELKNVAIFGSLRENTVPLGFAIRHSDRDLILKKLFNEQIYPPVHWLIEGLTPKKFGQSHTLAKQIMTLPCDQRYGEDNMFHLISCFLKRYPNVA
jgi:dTDP-4-amino-4,6-dideoxygalactose transaminase